LALSQACAKVEGLKLLNLKKNVHDLMQITELNTIFEIMDDEKVAIRSFDKSCRESVATASAAHS
jgi:hypothetical protein